MITKITSQLFSQSQKPPGPMTSERKYKVVEFLLSYFANGDHFVFKIDLSGKMG